MLPDDTPVNANHAPPRELNPDGLAAVASAEGTPAPAGDKPRGRPRTRAADRSEQVRQNMRLYRARRAAELAALGRELEQLARAVASGDPRQTYAAAAAVVGVWSNSILKDNVIKSTRQPGDGGNAPGADLP